MKTALLIALATAALTGCAVVPAGPGPGVYVAPPPPVMVVPAYPRYYYGPRWHRHWRY